MALLSATGGIAQSASEYRPNTPEYSRILQNARMAMLLDEHKAKMDMMCEEQKLKEAEQSMTCLLEYGGKGNTDTPHRDALLKECTRHYKNSRH